GPRRTHGLNSVELTPRGSPCLASIPFPLTSNPLPKEREPRSPYPGRNDVDGARTGDSSPSPWGEGWGEGDRSARLPMACSLEPSRNRFFVAFACSADKVGP